MIISDSSTLIILSDLNKLNLLSNLFSQIFIPPAVYQEINAKKKMILPNFIEIREVKNSEMVENLNMILDLGESQAIALALEMDLKLIIDEKKGRKIAMNQGITITGLLGIIYLNIKKGFITENEAKLFLNNAIENGYRINTKLINSMFDKL